MTEIFQGLLDAGFQAELISLSALDRYFRLPALPFAFVYTDGDLTDLARLFEKLRFPGPSVADAALDYEIPTAGVGGNPRTIFFYCRDLRTLPLVPYTFFTLTFDWKTQRFRDPQGIYPLIRFLWRGKKAEAFPPPAPWWEGLFQGADRFGALMAAAVLLARYGAPLPDLTTLRGVLGQLTQETPPEPETQRTLLTTLLSSTHPEAGFALLKALGFIDRFWPELAQLDDVDHSKEFHPEGNAWAHTLETFQYRKTLDFTLSLALLLHDVGKPLSSSDGAHRFDKHAELGALAAVKFLERLGFPNALITDVRFLVRNHMLPAAIPRLPLRKSEEIMGSALFPRLLELYRCDESSSYKGLQGYYESSAVYQSYRKNLRNPYRSADGKIKR
jgi:poly(A) polymerase